MASRPNQDTDGVEWNTVSVKLGESGLDLREGADSGLQRLDNARFVNETIISARLPHNSVQLQDGAGFPAVGDSITTDGWIYGHGEHVSLKNSLAHDSDHFPIVYRGAGLFSFGNSRVAWTGDRLLVIDENGAVGTATYWDRTGGTYKPYGLPAFLPLQTDSVPATALIGPEIQTLLTPEYRVVTYTDEDQQLYVTVQDRFTNALISSVAGLDTGVTAPKLVYSGTHIVLVWMRGDNTLQYSEFVNQNWTDIAPIVGDPNIASYDLFAVKGGFWLLYRQASPSTPSLKAVPFAGLTVQSGGYSVPLPVSQPNGAVAIAVTNYMKPESAVIVATAAGLQIRLIANNGTVKTPWVIIDSATRWGGISITPRLLYTSTGQPSYVVFADKSDNAVIAEYTLAFSTASQVGQRTNRYNTSLASKSFAVGNEVFCWLRAINSGTHYLAVGTGELIMSGFADREEATQRISGANGYELAQVNADPLDTNGWKFTWVRPFDTGDSYYHNGNTRIGDMDFVPELCAVAFGKSVYLSGSAVRHYDGFGLNDTGFQDYPIVVSGTVGFSADPPSPGVGLGFTSDNVTGTEVSYFVRVYPVRYNGQGERIQGVAKTAGPFKVTWNAAHAQTLTITINTLAATSHRDVQLEVYRTTGDGEAYYLDGVVSNDLGSAQVTYTSTRADQDTPIESIPNNLVNQKGDSFAKQVDGAPSEIQNWGPLGCSILAVSGSRIWGAGGQVPRGEVQFSKQHQPGQGVGFDDLAGYEELDTEGNAITSICRLNDTTVCHEPSQIFVITGVGPDNFGNGSFDVPQVVLADGAIAHAGTALTQIGQVYWGQNGPRLLSTTLNAVDNFAAQIRTLPETLRPVGVQVSLVRQEVLWYTDDNGGLLCNYMTGSPRWSRWTGLNAAACDDDSFITTDGQVMKPDDNAYGDGGRHYEFAWRTTNIRPGDIYQSATQVRAVGVAGIYQQGHELSIRVYYNGSPCWSDSWTWEPDETTWLPTIADMASLTPAQVDAETNVTDRSGMYMTHKRTSRQRCHFFQVEVSSLRALTQTYIPYELSLEVGVTGSLGRVPVSTFGK